MIFKKNIYLISEQLDRKQRKINLGNQSSLLHWQTVRKVVKQSPCLINTQCNTKLCTIGPTSTRLHRGMPKIPHTKHFLQNTGNITGNLSDPFYCATQ